MLSYSSGNSQQHHTYFFILLTATMKKSSYRPTTGCIKTYEKLAAETKNTTGVVIPTKLQDIKQPPTSLNFNPDICAICSCNNIGASSVTTDLLQPLWRSPFTSLLYGKSGIAFIKCLRVRNEPKSLKRANLCLISAEPHLWMSVMCHNKNSNELEWCRNIKLDLMTRNDAFIA